MCGYILWYSLLLLVVISILDYVLCGVNYSVFVDYLCVFQSVFIRVFIYNSVCSYKLITIYDQYYVLLLRMYHTPVLLVTYIYTHVFVFIMCHYIWYEVIDS
jgi:hypothetical protein